MEDINNNKQSSNQGNPESDSSNENKVNEPEVIYETQQITGFVMPQEWIEEAEEASRRLRNGESKGFTVEEFLARTKAMFKARFNIEFDDYNELSPVSVRRFI